MATVNFQCGHCHKLMAVGQENLGQQVRCPHCQQVVLAPAAPAPPPPEPALPTMDMPTIEVPRLEEMDSIFTPPEAALDDLFGEAPAPLIEIPTEPAFPRLGLEEPTVPTEPVPAGPNPLPPLDAPTTTAAEPIPAIPPTEVMSTDQGPLSSDPNPFAPPQEAPPPADDEPLLTITPSKPRTSRSNPWVIPLIIAPLAFYSLMATIYILDTRYMHFFTPPPPPHPLEVLPDLEGDNHGTAKRGKQTSFKYRGVDPDTPLPAKLRVGLGKTLAIGDLDITPEKVERRRPTWVIEGSNDEPFSKDVLSLTLKLHNRSSDVTFQPMDRFFARKWPSGDPGEIEPYTYLEMGNQKFYGGPLDWVSLETARRNQKRIENIKGQNVNQVLKPGQDMITFLCTDPDPKDPDPKKDAAKELEGYHGKLLWRVHLRRGLVKWTTAKGVDRDDPATAVVGVEFTAADVKNATD